MAVASSVAGFRGEGWKGLWQSLGPELGGAVVTYVLLDLVLGTRQRKESLVAKMGSHVRDEAIPAVEELRREGWLTDGSLRGAFLAMADLRGAFLWYADMEASHLIAAWLRRAFLVDAKLKEAIFWRADLQGATLAGADMERANLMSANLEGTSLKGANLRGAVLIDSNLDGATLEDANLEEAVVLGEQLGKAESLAGASLPDGTELSEDAWQAEFEEWRKKHRGRSEFVMEWTKKVRAEFEREFGYLLDKDEWGDWNGEDDD